MKKIIIQIFLFTAIISFSMSCSKDKLNVAPLDSVTDEAVFNSEDIGLMEAFIYNLYQGIPDGFNWPMLSNATDESHLNAGSWGGTHGIMRSELSPSNLLTFGAGGPGNNNNYYYMYNWDNLYKKIRGANLFLSKVDESRANADDKNIVKGEAFFIRAYLYNVLVSMYGGVPIIDEAYELDDEFAVPRDTYADCIQFISNQCDSAASYLPLTQVGGRATRGAALALKSRVLLFAASDLYNTDLDVAGYSNPELVRYTNISASDRQGRWQAAKDAAKAVMDLGMYSLYMPSPANGDEAAANYGQLFLEFNTPEDIFSRFYTTNVEGDWTVFMPHTFRNPCGYHGWGTTAPTQQFVDEYEMADGTAFDWGNAAHATDPYGIFGGQKRDPRFYATISYDRSYWRERPADVASKFPGIQTGQWWQEKDGTVSLQPGADAPGGVDSWNATQTGYYMRKAVDPTLPAEWKAAVQTAPWRLIRYTEILLNYAEACIELGQEGEARAIINQIRARAYMPAISNATMDAYRHERKIELAFEELRYFDIRRWKICNQVYENVGRVNIEYGSETNPAGADDDYGVGTPTYTTEIQTGDAHRRIWEPSHYFIPIQLEEMNRNTNLVQNPGY